jgi:hypothetical protein
MTREMTKEEKEKLYDAGMRAFIEWLFSVEGIGIVKTAKKVLCCYGDSTTQNEVLFYKAKKDGNISAKPFFSVPFGYSSVATDEMMKGFFQTAYKFIGN